MPGPVFQRRVERRNAAGASTLKRTSSIARLLKRPFVAGLLCGLVTLAAVRYVINHTTLADAIVGPLMMADTDGPADAIVALGAAVSGECVPNLNGVRRVLLAAQQWREGRAPLIVFTGGSSADSCAVGVAMAQLARQVGVPESSIVVEAASRSTRENAAFSAPLLQQRGIHRIILVTDRLHMRRGVRAFEPFGFAVGRASVPIWQSHSDNVSMLQAGLREYVALGWYRTRGWLTKRGSR